MADREGAASQRVDRGVVRIEVGRLAVIGGAEAHVPKGSVLTVRQTPTAGYVKSCPVAPRVRP